MIWWWEMVAAFWMGSRVVHLEVQRAAPAMLALPPPSATVIDLGVERAKRRRVLPRGL